MFGRDKVPYRGLVKNNVITIIVSYGTSVFLFLVASLLSMNRLSPTVDERYICPINDCSSGLTFGAPETIIKGSSLGFIFY